MCHGSVFRILENRVSVWGDILVGVDSCERIYADVGVDSFRRESLAKT
jgi:hypothetical protein